MVKSDYKSGKRYGRQMYIPRQTDYTDDLYVRKTTAKSRAKFLRSIGFNAQVVPMAQRDRKIQKLSRYRWRVKSQIRGKSRRSR